MLGIMGNIDQQVSDKADSMQMQGKTSTVSKDLLDVMATQRIAREKDTALKELQMAQQQNPNTIKDQLEQKVMGMTQNEMTNQTAGIMAQQQQQKRPQQQQQRPPQQGGIAAMGGAPKPPMGGMPRPPMAGAPKPPMGGMPRPPMAGGIASAAPRPPMMASGGVVGYNKGGVSISDDKLKLLGLTRRQYEALPEATKRKILQDDTASLGYNPARAAEQRKQQEEATKKELQSIANIPAGIGRAIESGRKSDAIETAKNLGVTAEDLGQYDTSGIARAMDTLKEPAEKEPFLPTPTGKMPAPAPAPAQAPNTTATTDASATTKTPFPGIESLDPRKAATAGQGALAENQRNISDRVGEDLMSKVRQDAATDPKAERGAETDRLKDLYGLEELRAMQTGEQADIKAAQDRYDSPQARRARNAANFMRGGARGRAEGKVNRQELDLKRLRQKQEDRRKNNQELFQRLEKVDSGSRQMFQDMMTQQQAAFASVESIAANDELAKQNMAQLEFGFESKVQDLVLEAMGVATQSEFNQLLMRAEDTNKLLSYWSTFTQGLKDLESERLAEVVPQMQDVFARQAKGENVDNELIAIETAKKMIQGHVYANTQHMLKAFAQQWEKLNPGSKGVAELAMLSGSSMPSGISSLQPSGMGQFGNRQLSSPAMSSKAALDIFNKNTPQP